MCDTVEIDQVLMKRDVYSGSIIVNELVTRQMAWEHPHKLSKQELLTAVLNGGRPPMEPCDTLATEKRITDLQHLIVSGWSQEPTLRPTSQAILDGLTSI